MCKNGFCFTEASAQREKAGFPIPPETRCGKGKPVAHSRWNLKATSFFRPRNGRNSPGCRRGKKITLELRDTRRLQPHPLFCLLHPHGRNHDFQRNAAFDDGLNNGLPGTAFMDIFDQVAINFDPLRLELRQQQQACESGAKVIDGHPKPGCLQ